MSNNTFSDVIAILVDEYRRYSGRFHEAFHEQDKVMMSVWMHERNAIYDALMRIADYDEDTVIDWLNT